MGEPVSGYLGPNSDSESLREIVRCPNCGTPMIRVPVLACTYEGCSRLHPLRCFTYMSEGLHIAECIDLDLVSQGRTVEEAIGKLQEAMFGYLKVAFSDGSTKGLILR